MVMVLVVIMKMVKHGGGDGAGEDDEDGDDGGDGGDVVVVKKKLVMMVKIFDGAVGCFYIGQVEKCNDALAETGSCFPPMIDLHNELQLW